MEVWGAEGGTGFQPNDNTIYGAGGKGGVANGHKNINSNTILYIVIGGRGINSSKYNNVVVSGGYNGGGHGGSNHDTTWGGGGGATHIATKNGLLKNLENDIDKIFIVAGGGGGGGTCLNKGINNAGNGGGENGGDGMGARGAHGGTQVSGGTSLDAIAGSFGQGGEIANSSMGSGGGGGWYGGGSAVMYGSSAGGGSGYIGGVTNGSTTSGVQSGNGKALITWMPVL